MLYFKNTELAEKYRVSLKTVYNWISVAKTGKLALELHEHNGKTFIANTPSNIQIMDVYAQEGKKKRALRFSKVAEPTPEFYELYTRKQMLDIITKLSINREIPRQYNYLDNGAVNWDKHSQRQWHEDSPNLLKSTVELLEANFGAIDKLLGSHKKINIIDIGPGNALPVKGLLQHLIDRGNTPRYIAIDISEEMLHIAQKNINEWFGDKIKFEGYVRDITYERFDDLLVDDMLEESAAETINVALLLGATPMNFPEPDDILKGIRNSLSQNDLVIYTDKPDSEQERRSFNFGPTPAMPNVLSPNHRFIFDLLNVDESLYDVEMGFNESKRMRYIRVRFKMPLTIKFSFDTIRREVHIDKGETILLWRAWHMSALQIIQTFENAGLTLLLSNLTSDRNYLLTISGVESIRNDDA